MLEPSSCKQHWKETKQNDLHFKDRAKNFHLSRQTPITITLMLFVKCPRCQHRCTIVTEKNKFI